MNTIAIDVHISTLEFVAMKENGKIFKREKKSTSEFGLMEFIRSVPKPRKIFIEEGTLASWIVETARSYGEEVIVMDPKRNHWISKDEDKSDEIDAEKIALLAKGGNYKEIRHAIGERRRFREFVLFYHDLVKTRTRIKNKIKGKFRQYGILCEGETVYKKEYDVEWENKLPSHPMIHFMIRRLKEQLNKIQDEIEDTIKILKKQSLRFPEIKLFQAVPGIGLIHSVTISAILEDPNRFSTKKKVWKYSGLGIVKKSSSNRVYTERLSHEFNRTLKYSLKQAVLTTIQTDNPFRKKYMNMIVKGVPHHRALLSTARSLITTLWVMWKKGEKYSIAYRES